MRRIIKEELLNYINRLIHVQTNPLVKLNEMSNKTASAILSQYDNDFTIAYEIELEIKDGSYLEDFIGEGIEDAIIDRMRPSEDEFLEQAGRDYIKEVFVSFGEEVVKRWINSGGESVEKLANILSIEYEDEDDAESEIANELDSTFGLLTLEEAEYFFSKKQNNTKHPLLKKFYLFISEMLSKGIQAIAGELEERWMPDPTAYAEALQDYIEYAEDEVYKGVIANLLPNVYRKWGDHLKYENDTSLDNGLEFSPKSYHKSVSEAFTFLDDLYHDLQNQKVLEMSNKTTGLHTNIGSANSEEDDWNILKLILMVNEKFAVRGFDWRHDTRYARTIKDKFFAKLKNEFIRYSQEELESLFKVNGFKQIEKYFSEVVKGIQGSSKYFGINLRNLHHNYIEFRYPGGEVSKNEIKQATIYYCHLVKLATDPEYHKIEYIKRLYKFISSMRERPIIKDKKIEKSKAVLNFISRIRKGDKFLFNLKQLGREVEMTFTKLDDVSGLNFTYTDWRINREFSYAMGIPRFIKAFKSGDIKKVK